MPDRFSDSVQKLLAAAGWSEGRDVPIEGITAFLEEHGSCVADPAVEFLKEFHGLRLASCGLQFDVYSAARLVSPADTRHLESIVGQSLCLIGKASYGILFMSPSAKVIHLAIDWVQVNEFKDYAELFEAVSGTKPALSRPIPLKRSQLPEHMRDDVDEDWER